MSYFPFMVVLWAAFIIMMDGPFSKRTTRSNRWAAILLFLSGAGIGLYVWTINLWYSPAHALLHWLEPLSPH